MLKLKLVTLVCRSYGHHSGAAGILCAVHNDPQLEPKKHLDRSIAQDSYHAAAHRIRTGHMFRTKPLYACSVCMPATVLFRRGNTVVIPSGVIMLLSPYQAHYGVPRPCTK